MNFIYVMQLRASLYMSSAKLLNEIGVYLKEQIIQEISYPGNINFSLYAIVNNVGLYLLHSTTCLLGHFKEVLQCHFRASS